MKSAVYSSYNWLSRCLYVPEGMLLWFCPIEKKNETRGLSRVAACAQLRFAHVMQVGAEMMVNGA